MLSFPPGLQVFMAVEPIDMRKSFDGLSAAVQAVFDRKVLDGHLFLFLNRRRDLLKCLWWDRDGLAIFAKKFAAQYPCFLAFTGIGEDANNLARGPIAVVGMDSSPSRIGPRRRPMSGEIAVFTPPRAQFFASPPVSTGCGIG